MGGLPVETPFKLPAPIPAWPPGNGFASGTIDLGGLQVSQVSTFNKTWAINEGGPTNAGVSFFDPIGMLVGFFMLGCYCQPNNKPLFGSVLVAKDISNGALKRPADYTLVWSSQSANINQDINGFVWLPIAPDGYKAVGYVVTTTPEKPSLDRIRCVREEFTDQIEIDSWIWGLGKDININGFNVFSVRPSNRGTQAPGVLVGTFLARTGGDSNLLPIACLKNTKANSIYLPNQQQIKALVEAYGPFMYLHPDEPFQPSSVDWFFANGALLYKKGEESKPVGVQPNGTNLPQDANSDDSYWLDLPADDASKDRVKKGNLSSFQTYVHVKPMFGGTFTDLAMWMFYPFNGPSRAKVLLLTIPLGTIGEHVGDWEHVTLRISNFNGGLWRVYYSQHSKGTWVDASELEFQRGNKFVVYSSLNGHASYPNAGTFMQGSEALGIRNDCDKGLSIDMGQKFELVSVEHLGSEIREPPWLNYSREWGPKIHYNLDDKLKDLVKSLPGIVQKPLIALVKKLPLEVLGEEGPVGPKAKGNWNGDEV